MILDVALLINNVGLFVLEILGYHACHSVVMLLDGYYHLCQGILCTVRIVSRLIQFKYSPRQTYGLARVGVVGELVAFVSFLALSVSVFLESIKHIIDVIFIIPEKEINSSALATAHGDEHIHSLIDYPHFILGVGIYATISNCLLGIAIVYFIIKRSETMNKQTKERRSSLTQPLPKKLLSKSLLITDTLSTRHSLLQVLNMLLGPLAILTCGILLVTLSERQHAVVLISRLIDPIICSFLFLSYLFMIATPLRDVVHLVLQANPCSVKSNEIEKALRDSIPSIVGIHELHIWRLSPQKTLATVHVVFNTPDNFSMKYKDIHSVFETFHVDHVTIQPEFTTDEIEKLVCHYQCATNNTECGPLQCCDNRADHADTTTSCGN